jgi:catechol 2,3-dioxygenase-like lactoylglutathione lyase family enzyme
METVINNLLKAFEAGKISRRQLIQSLALAATAASVPQVSAAPASHRGFKTVEVNHISYQVRDYRVTRDFYVDLMGMKVIADAWRGRGECVLTWDRGPASYFIPRNHPSPQGETASPDAKPVIDHIAFTIENWDRSAVEAELKRRGLNPRPDTDDSFIIKDPDGFTLQICGPGLSAENATYKPAK